MPARPVSFLGGGGTPLRSRTTRWAKVVRRRRWEGCPFLPHHPPCHLVRHPLQFFGATYRRLLGSHGSGFALRSAALCNA